MPDERLLHKRAAHSDKISALTDFEYRVWTTYLMNADDYGVMRFSVAALQSGCDALEHRPSGQLKRAFQRLVDIHLLRVFDHQGKTFAYQSDWQDYQNIRYPRLSVLPSPPEELTTECSPAQQKLFALKLRNAIEKSERSSGNIPETSPTPARAGGRETLTANANAPAIASAQGGAGGNLTASSRRGNGLLATPLDWHRKHESVHVVEFCDFVCLPNELRDGFARKVTGVEFDQAKHQVGEWAREIRRQWQGRVVPDGNDYDFWRNRWTETHGGSKPQTAAQAPDPLAGLRKAR